MPLMNPPVIIQENGTTQGAVNTVNFTTGITASVAGNIATVSATGSSNSFTMITVNFGTLPVRTKTFIITDSNVSPTSHLIISQSGTAAPGRQSDENEMDPILFSGTPGSGQFILIANALTGPITGKYNVNYVIG
jgi:hypothetical protein